MKHLIGGVVAICLGLWGMLTWWGSFGMVMRGLVPFALLGLGLLAIVSGFRRMSEAPATPEAEAPPEGSLDAD
ncbi:MAG: hypothetical protein HY898_36610 [Deltaproteobacteria bacterium]|nr:hypothetical protein [Deltaproteobacteria bacterium]